MQYVCWVWLCECLCTLSMSTWVKVCVCVHARAQATVHPLGAFFVVFFFQWNACVGDRRTDSGAPTHPPLMHVFIRALGEAERAGQ